MFPTERGKFMNSNYGEPKPRNLNRQRNQVKQIPFKVSRRAVHMVSGTDNSITRVGKTLLRHCTRLLSVFRTLGCARLHDRRHRFSLATKAPVAVAICYSNIFLIV